MANNKQISQIQIGEDLYDIVDTVARANAGESTAASSALCVRLGAEATNCKVSLPSNYSDCIVDWDDGNILQGNTHTYTETKYYSIRIYLSTGYITDFSTCTGLSLQTVSIEGGDGNGSIASEAFQNCVTLNSVYISGISSIYARAFEGCTALKSVTLDEGLTGLYGGFQGCTSLKKITIPNSVTHYGNKLFENCTSLTQVKLSSQAKELAQDMFLGCTSLSCIAIPDGVESLSSRTFKGCSSLIGVTIPKSMDSVYSYAFEGCTGLLNVSLHNAVTYIGHEAFLGCSSLVSIEIPASVQGIGEYAFKDCSNLRKMVFKDRYEVLPYTNFIANVHSDIQFVFENKTVAQAFLDDPTWEANYGKGSYKNKYTWIRYSDLYSAS